MDKQTVALLLWHWEHHRTWTTNPGVQTRPESVRFPKHQKHSRTSRTIGIQQPNYTLTFDTPWHTFSCFMLFPTGLHLRSRRGPSSFKAKSFLSFPETILPVQDATNNEKNTPCTNIRTNMHKHEQTKPRDHLCGHSLAESLRYGVCQLWWFLQVQGFRSKMPPKGKNEMGNWSATNPLCALHISSCSFILFSFLLRLRWNFLFHEIEHD